MRHSVSLRVLAAVVGLLGCAAHGEAGRDWNSHPAVVEVDSKHDVYALGDVHGDYERLITLLHAARVIAAVPTSPEKVRWSAGKAVLVCTGDMIDKWNEGLRVIALFRALAADAARHRGRVIVVMGNHEAEFLAARGVGKKFALFVKELKARKLDPGVVADGHDPDGVGAWLRNLPFAARVNDWFFAHACNTRGRSLAQLKAELRAGVDARGFGAGVLSDRDSLLEARLHPRPWWEKPGDTSSKARERLAKNVETLGVKHLVMGHQPGKVTFAGGGKRKEGELAQHFDGLIFFIDVGMSRGVGFSTGALLRIRGESSRADVVTADGKVHMVWKR